MMIFNILGGKLNQIGIKTRLHHLNANTSYSSYRWRDISRTAKSMNLIIEIAELLIKTKGLSIATLYSLFGAFTRL
ncbi:hypothetical protein BBP83_11055 [Acinetobacter celticus]|uniref:Uncharacterized protein n=1 Tax=Acinetobacter celticus TaxID=1891224 RepID=A0A1C3CUH3_9GAMM|nr:hypothetical protein BBP83_11055 [Acinetobacter celticus]